MAVRHLFRVIIQDCSATKEEGWFYGATGIVGLGRHRSSVVIGRPLGRSMLYDFIFLLDSGKENRRDASLNNFLLFDSFDRESLF